MAVIETPPDDDAQSIPKPPPAWLSILRMLYRDKFALCAAVFLVIVVFCAVFGPMLLGEAATDQDLRGRNAPPFDFSKHWTMWLGGDALGRPLLARIIGGEELGLKIS